MAPSTRKSKVTKPSAKDTSKSQAPENQTKVEPKKTAKIKSKQKKTTKRWIWVGLIVVIFAIGLALIVDKFDISNIVSEKRKYEFAKVPVPEFDIGKGIERRSNLSLEEFTELYDAKW